MTSPATYLLPIKASAPPSAELTDYLRWVSRRCPLVIVDGSDPDVFDAAHAAWSTVAVHVAPDPHHRCANGKVHGVLTGLDHITTSTVVIADDDVRYDDRSLDAVLDSLEGVDVVVPQNYFSPTPWHARWDTARSLINRATGADFPGTLAVRVATLRSTSGYDGDVLFENLELIRTVEAVGGATRWRPDIFVCRLPPTTRHFFSQRVRQAYDELARPRRLAVALSVIPAIACVRPRHRLQAVAFGAATAITAAEIGRRRMGGRDVYPPSSALFAPLWTTERAVCAWMALATRALGGVPYAGARLRLAANSPASLRQRHAGTSRPDPVSGR